MPQLDGKTALITGGSIGIGAATAAELAGQGAHVILTYRSHREEAESIVQKIAEAGGSAQCTQTDVTIPQQIEELANFAQKSRGRVDILFNNAGDLVRRATIEEQSLELYHQVMDLNIMSTWLVTKTVLALMKPGGVVVNMASLAARNGGGPGASLYGASKAAVISLTRAWAVEFADKGIRVFSVAPGFIDTDFHKRHTAPDVGQQVAETCPTRKAGEPSDVARVVAFLATETNGFMTGNTIDINGGVLMT